MPKQTDKASGELVLFVDTGGAGHKALTIRSDANLAELKLLIKQNGWVADWDVSCVSYHGEALESDAALLADLGIGAQAVLHVAARPSVRCPLSAGDQHSLALVDGGGVAARGRNNYGQCDVPAEVQGRAAGVA
eukprot:gene13084-3266_t